MNNTDLAPPWRTVDAGEISLLALGAILLRRRRLIFILVVAGAAVGVLSGLLRSRQYASGTVIIPQSSESPSAGLALAASQLGIRIPSGGSGWGPPVYVELLGSRSVLDAIAQDTVVVTEDANRRVALMDLLEVDRQSGPMRAERAVIALRRVITAAEDKKLGAVRVTVATHWPSVSLAVIQHLMREVNRFNLETRKSQAGAERQFVEIQARDAESALRQAEDRLQLFLQTNRVFSSPQLTFERERLQRDIGLRQNVYTSLVQSREEARMREVRDTPTITVLEAPRLPMIPEPRNSAMKGVLGGILGGLAGVMLAFLMHAVSGARKSPTTEAREFFQAVEQITPRFLVGRSRS